MGEDLGRRAEEALTLPFKREERPQKKARDDLSTWLTEMSHSKCTKWEQSWVRFDRSHGFVFSSGGDDVWPHHCEL